MTAPVRPEGPGLLNWCLILTLGVIWGAAFLSVRLALNGFGPWTVAAGRTLIAAIILIVLGQIMGQGLNRIGGMRGALAAMSFGVISVALPFSLLSWGQQYVVSAFAGVAMGLIPLLVLPLSYLTSADQDIGPRRLIGIALGFVGLVILIGPSAFGSSGQSLETLGRLACLGAAMTYATGSIITRKGPSMPPITYAAASLITAAAILVPIALLREGLPGTLPVQPSLALLYVAIGPTALAAIIRFRVITTAGPIFMSLTSYMVPVWSVIFGITLLGEDLPPNLLIALALILSGIGFSQLRNLRGRRRRAR